MSLIIFFTSWILCLLPLLAPFLQLSRIYLHRHVNRKHQTSTAVKQKATRQHSTAVKPVLCIRIPIGSIFITLWNRIHISSGIRIHTGKKYHKSEAKGVRLKKKNSTLRDSTDKQCLLTCLLSWQHYPWTQCCGSGSAWIRNSENSKLDPDPE